ncbi:bacteriocin fulvocin C-related protein [Sorangium sp. So ce1036]|uniref:bacteriocin fulvocin C-related protein n=1 Tax=Sorangium sp. So ce1036 TaxID=3133328 RepID=UPI003EFEDA35
MMRTGCICSMFLVMSIHVAMACGLGCETTSVQLAPDGISAEDDGGKVQDWIAANRDRLPSTYDELVRFPPQYRKAIFAAQTPEVRSVFFRSQFERYREQHPSLSAEQRAALAYAIELTTPELFSASRYSPGPERSVDAKLRELQERMIAAFGVDEARGLVAQLGPLDPAATKQPFGRADEASR